MLATTLVDECQKGGLLDTEEERERVDAAVYDMLEMLSALEGIISPKSGSHFQKPAPTVPREVGYISRKVTPRFRRKWHGPPAR
jgi:hypothetical protein